MKLFTIASVLVGAVVSVLGQTIELDYPTDGTILHLGEQFTSRISRPQSPIGCTEVGIALSIASCDNNECPQPTERLGSVLYAGPYNPTPHPDGYYEDFSLTVPEYMTPGPAIFDLTHLCLLGGGPIPLLEFRNASIVIEP